MVERGLRRRLEILRATKLTCLAAWLGACTSADGHVFRSPDGLADLPCMRAPFVIQKTGVSGFNLDYASRDPMVVAQIQDDARLYRVSLSQTHPVVSPSVVGRSGYTYGVVPVGGDGPLWMVFQNHSLAGQWRIYGALWNESTGLDATLVTVSSDGTENVGPKAARLGARLGIAFRQDSHVAFAVIEGAAVVSRHVGEDVSPHPVILRVLTRPEGFVVVYKRTTAALAYYDPVGKAAGGVPLPGAVADVTTVGGSLVAITAEPSGLQRITFDAGGAPVPKPLNVDAANVKVLRVATQSNHVALAFLENEGGDAAQLRFLWNQGESSLVYPRFGAPNALDLDVVPTAEGALVMYRTDVALMGRFYCSATTP